MGDRRGVPPPGVVGRGGRGASACFDQHLQPPHPARELDRAGATRARDVASPGRTAGAGTHGNGADAEHRTGAAASAGAQAAGRVDLDRRLRHRILVAFASHASADRHAEDRPLVRARTGGERQQRGDRHRDHRDGTQPEPARRRRGRRDALPDAAPSRTGLSPDARLVVCQGGRHRRIPRAAANPRRRQRLAPRHIRARPRRHRRPRTGLAGGRMNMNDLPGAKAAQAEVARRVLKTLAERRIIPTPETFTEVYNEISGIRSGGGNALAAVFKDILRDLVRAQRMTPNEAQAALQQAQGQNWDAVREGVDKALARRPGGSAASWPQMAVTLLRQADALHANWTRARKLDAVTRVVDAAGEQPDVALDRLARLLESWGPAMAPLPSTRDDAAGPATVTASPNTVTPAATMPVAQRYGSDPAIAEKLAATCPEGSTAAQRLRDYARSRSGPAPRVEIDKIVPQFVDAVREFDRHVDEQNRVRDGLQRLLALLTDNIKTLAPDETWLVGQLEPIRALLRGPLDAQQLSRAESDLNQVIARQGEARRSLAEAKVAVKELLATLIERIGSMGSSTGRFYEQVGSYQKQLESANDFTTLSDVIRGLLADTQIVRADIHASRAELVDAQRKVDAYETRVRELEHELTQVSALVQKDPLTQAMNRRGLEEAFRIETARATRYESPLVLGMLDLDDFKKLNDSLGHVAGDRALVHLAQIMKASLRPTDLLARLGGEEFAVLFPATDAEEATSATERLQRELARSNFSFEGQRAQLAFSAGVATWRRAETLEELMRRADDALYAAKRAGKNRVSKAQE